MGVSSRGTICGSLSSAYSLRQDAAYVSPLRSGAGGGGAVHICRGGRRASCVRLAAACHAEMVDCIGMGWSRGLMRGGAGDEAREGGRKGGGGGGSLEAALRFEEEDAG